jgi:AcrR family transcriptional regulator
MYRLDTGCPLPPPNLSGSVGKPSGSEWTLDQPEPTRADALRNREAILEAARDVFTESAGASMNAIAKRAGVGPGTLYRHFRTRESLILAVYRHELQRLVDSVEQDLADHEPLDAFHIWFRRLVAATRVKYGLGGAMHLTATNEAYAPVTAAVGRLLDACAAAGTMRSGLDPADVLALLSCLWRVGDGKLPTERIDRLLALAIQGLRP